MTAGRKKRKLRPKTDDSTTNGNNFAYNVEFAAHKFTVTLHIERHQHLFAFGKVICVPLTTVYNTNFLGTRTRVIIARPETNETKRMATPPPTSSSSFTGNNKNTNKNDSGACVPWKR